MNSLKKFYSDFKSSSIKIYCLHILIVLSGTTLGLYYLQLGHLIVPVTLGAIAAAITDFDDRLSIRLRNLLYTCILFFSISSLLELIDYSKFLLILTLSLCSSLLVLMGALGQRYATISFGTILLSVYTLFGLGEYPHWYQQPSYFVLGALWYGLSSILFYLLKPTQAVQDQLAQSFVLLSRLLELKAQLFDPDHSEQAEELLYQLSLQNSEVVQQLNQCKATLLTRLKASRANQHTIHWLNLYFAAQDIHEQATANYLHYEKIAENFGRTDLIYRLQKNFQLQAKQGQQLAQSILDGSPFKVPSEPAPAFLHLLESLQDWIKQNPDNQEVKNLNLVLNNLKTIQEQFLTLGQEHPADGHHNESLNRRQDNLNLLDDDIQGLADLWLKLKQHMGPQSALFRHAIRIGFIFAAGSLISLLPFAKNGYWILLTGLFVCQMSYFATKNRLRLRTLGTVLGVLCGVPLLYFVPSVEGQLILTILCGVAFFYLRSKKYAMATLMATLMVLLIFNLKGAGYAIILPRIMDTLLGCGLAWFAVSFIWPDWNFRNISRTMLKSQQATLSYFAAVIGQYQQGRNNSMQYRIARREAHNAHIELSSMISSLSTEPHPNPIQIHYAFRYLVYSHSQLSYVSALGSHRVQIEYSPILSLMQAIWALLAQLTEAGSRPDENSLQQYLQDIRLQQTQVETELEMLVLKQLSLILETLTELIQLRNELWHLEIK